MIFVHGDLHIHIGSAQGRAIKITASRSLTLKNVIYESAPKKGLDMVGVVDAGTVPVSAEIEQMIAGGELKENPRGGLCARNGVLLIPACEIESIEGVHWVIYLPSLKSIKQYQKYIRSRVTNMELSTQRTRVNARELVNLSLYLNGILCPAHAFTPHKGLYGAWISRLQPVLKNDFNYIKSLELGLSADTDMADTLAETRGFTFLSNSDAHSAANIGREYNLFRMQEKNFEELKYCLLNKDGRRVVANYGMDPLLGKYHRSYCSECDTIAAGAPPVFTCDRCGATNMIKGVYDRIVEIRDRDEPHHPVGRPPYYYRVPLKELPGVGPKMLHKLNTYFDSEIYVLEYAETQDIAKIAGEKTAVLIENMRKGRLSIEPGGGGHYGKVKKNNCNY